MRIGSSFPQPRDRRMMSSWLSYRDLTELVRRSLFTPDIGHIVVYGASANRDLWWDNRLAAPLGFAPQDTSEIFRDQVEALPRPAANDPVAVFQGGAFTTQGPFED
jgi:uronate dehydrogenase